MKAKNLEKTLKKFSNIKYFDYVDKKIIFGSSNKFILSKLYDHINIFKDLLLFGKKYKLKFSKYNCDSLYYFSPINLLTFRYLINIIKHKNLKAYKLFKINFSNKQHFLSPIYNFFFNIKLDLCELRFKNKKKLTSNVGFNFKFKEFNKKNKINLSKFYKIKKNLYFL